MVRERGTGILLKQLMKLLCEIATVASPSDEPEGPQQTELPTVDDLGSKLDSLSLDTPGTIHHQPSFLEEVSTTISKMTLTIYDSI